MISADQYATQSSTYFETRTAEIFKLYQKRLQECNGMDFDDLLFHTVNLLAQNREIGERYRNRFKYLMVDEYQDTNRVQYLLLKHILGGHNNICVVGDEDQSIYGWRGADISNILNFEKDFPGARVIKLERNYRSTSIILQAASSVIKNNEMRKGKTLYTDTTGGENVGLLLVDNAEEEAHQVINLIERRRAETTLKESAVLYRTNAQSRAFEEQLRRKGLPYQIVGGVGFYQRKEIKDLLAYLKLIANPKDDISFERVVNYPKRAIGGKTVGEIVALARVRSVPSLEVAREAEAFEQLLSRSKRILPFVELIDRYAKRAETEPVDLIAQDLVEELNLIEHVREEDPATGQTRVENIEAFIEGAAEFAHSRPEAKLNDYLQEISLFTDLDAYREIEDKITLMTIHSAKGLEFDAIYIAGLEEGLLPLDNSIGDANQLEEERRLFYVGATRARKRLCLSAATERFRFGHVESIPSRFISEIDEHLLERFDRRTRRFAQSAGNRIAQPSLSFDQGRSYDYEAPARPKKPTPAPSGEYYEYEESEMAQVGRVVQHPTFGRGKIIKSEGFGESLRLEIMFSGLGVKKILAKYAKLKIIG
jgi:DNA helicase-2/ATP-dependent DNA helicase PcrA